MRSSESLLQAVLNVVGSSGLFAVYRLSLDVYCCGMHTDQNAQLSDSPRGEQPLVLEFISVMFLNNSYHDAARESFYASPYSYDKL